MRMISPSRSTSPTVAEAATTLCTQIILPAAPPMACSATTHPAPAAPRPICSAVENWNNENIMFEIVFDPATKAPIDPISGANIGQALPTTAETLSASTIGIDAIVSEAELMNTCTIGTANSSAGAAAIMVDPDVRNALP